MRQLDQGKRIGVWLATGLVVVIFLVEGGSKLAGADLQIENFQRWGYPLWLMYTIGTIEILGALALLWPRTAPYAAVALLPLMGGAIVTHLVNGEYPIVALPIVTGVLLAIVGWARRPKAWSLGTEQRHPHPPR